MTEKELMVMTMVVLGVLMVGVGMYGEDIEW